MNKIYLVMIFGLLASVAAPVMAAELEVVSCKLDLNGGQYRPELKLVVDGTGSLTGWSGDLDSPLVKSTQLAVFPILPVESDFVEALKRVNRYRNTGINPSAIGLVQKIFIGGDSASNSALYRIYGKNGNFLGWLASATGLSGCYRD